mgnify:CR=1 FL=1
MSEVLTVTGVEHVSGRERLTDKRLDRLSAPPGSRVEVADTIVRELRMRVSEKGAKSWSVLYRVAGAGEGGRRGKMSRMTLGGYPLLSLEKARDKAREALDAADRGLDPAAKRVEDVARQKTQSVEAVLHRYIELHVKQNTKEGRFARDREAALDAARQTGSLGRVRGPKRKLGRVAAERIIAENALTSWRGRTIDSISRAEVHDLLDDVIAEDGVALARELRKHLSAMFNWAADRGHLLASPMAGMRRPELGYKARERVLSLEELQRIWAAAGEIGYPFGAAYRLLILTSLRRCEVAELERSWLGEGAAHIEIPASRYKTGKPHVCPLNDEAKRLIRELPLWNRGDCVFSTTGGLRPISGFSKAKERIDAKIEKAGLKTGLPPLDPWTVHDLRRSVATHMARLGIAQ